MATTKAPIDTETGEILDEAAIEEEIDADPTIAKAAHNVGQRLLSAMIDELTAAGVRRSDETQYILDRFERRIKSELRRGFGEMLADGVPAVPATLGKVTFDGKAIQGVLAIDKSIKHKHTLADFAGRDVLVVLADDVEEHMVEMQELDLSDIPPLSNEELTAMAENVKLATGPSDDERSIKELQQDAFRLAGEIGENDITVEDVMSWKDEHLRDYVKYAEEKVLVARTIFEDGNAVALSPDPDCDICLGNGGYDVEVGDGEEWVKCTCTELPA